MKNIVIYCSSLLDEGDPFNSPYYLQAYLELILFIKSLGHNIYLASDDFSTYGGNGVFNNLLTTDKVCEFKDFTTVKSVTADCVLNKSKFIPRDVTVVTDKKLFDIANDKFKTHELFSHLQATTLLCNNSFEFESALKQLQHSALAVVKPVSGNSGNGVIVNSPINLLKEGSRLV